MENQKLNCIIKEPYYNHFIHLISFGSIWLVASLIGLKHYENVAIMFLFAGLCLFNTVFEQVRRMFSLCPMPCDDPLRIIITCMTISVPVGLVICFLPFMHNINAFFYVFGILFGLVFILVAFLYKLKRYFMIGLALIAGELYLLYAYDSFSTGGFFAAGLLVIYGLFLKIWGESREVKAVE